MTKRRTDTTQQVKEEKLPEDKLVVDRDEYVQLKTRVDMLEKFILKGEK